MRQAAAGPRAPAGRALELPTTASDKGLIRDGQGGPSIRHADTLPVSRDHRHHRRHRLRGNVCAGHPRRAEEGGDHRPRAARQAGCQAMKGAARVEAFLEMMSAERGAADNTLQSYRRDLEDAAEQLASGLTEASTAELRVYLDG